jgi:hypothetical protein
MFEEKQYFFKNKIIWILPIIFIGLLLISGISTGFSFTNIVSYIMFFIIMLLFSFMHLETNIDDTGIHYKFIPFIFKKKTIEWITIEKISVVEYNPIGDFGGWGIRGWGKRRALNVYGNKGIQILFKNGDYLLLGTNKMEDIKNSIDYFNKKK